MGTDAWGIDDGYWDTWGEWRQTPYAIAEQLRGAMGAREGQSAPPAGDRPLWVVQAGAEAALADRCELVLEDGTTVRVGAHLPPDLPIGYHDLRPLGGGPTTRLIATPGRCHMNPGLRRWLLAVQLYACRSDRSWGIGDFGELRRIAAWATERGAGMVALNPLHAPLPTDHIQPSPYFASSRRWLNPLYLEIERLLGASDDPHVAKLATQARQLDTQRRIDHDAVWRTKRAALGRLWGELGPDLRFERWRADQGSALETYARFCALAEHHESGWSGWPAEHRHPDRPEVARFAAENAGRVAFWAWVQLLCHDQLQRTSEVVPILHDLAIGVDPDGADAWADQDLLALEARVGAPPDQFNSAGQDWGLPPFVPWKLRAVGYAPLAELWGASLRRGGGLRIDHAMGLFRLFWLLPQRGPTEGAYVRYHGDELLAVLAIESTRAGSLVVGEDLGTVEDEAREALHDAGVLVNRLVWFEDMPIKDYPEQALTAVTTHDLPTVAGVWSGADADEQRAMGHLVDENKETELRSRLVDLTGCRSEAPVEDVIVAVHSLVARAPSMLTALTMEDALAVRERPNMPGTTTERPNWSLGLPVTLDDALASPLANRLAATMQRGRSSR